MEDKDLSQVIPKLSATLMLVRDNADGIEVFMVVRHHQIDFASGAMVFPGGKLDKGDSDPALRAFCTGTEGLDAKALSIRIAGIREAFEECGVLFARGRGDHRLVDAARLEKLGPWAARLHSAEVSMLEFLQEEQLKLVLDAMQPFAHWVTPPHMPKRFNTHFFLAAAPPDQVAFHDGKESVDSAWACPRKILAQADEHRVKLVFATRLNLEKLSRSANVVEALSNARQSEIVRVQPELISQQDGVRQLVIPLEAGYGGTHFSVTDKPSM
jgi:8-oxo-dGTP pyrophosphatase MutT (NUDIX family)